MFKGKKFWKYSLAGAGVCILLIASLLVAQTMFMQVPGGGLLFDQFNPVVRYAGRLSFQNLSGTLHVKAPITATGTLDFASATTGTCSDPDLTISATGAAVGDTVLVGPPAAAVSGATTNTIGSVYFGWVSSADLIGVRHCNISGGTINPASGSYRVDAFGH